MSVEEKKHNLSFVVKSFVAGGVAGMTAKSFVAPLDRIKILLQAHNSHYKHFGVFSGLKNIVHQETALGLYKGNGAQMVRIFPYAAIQFMAFEVYKKNLIIFVENHHKSNSSQPHQQHHGLKFVAGSLAGLTAAMMTYPLDLVRARLAFHVPVAEEVTASAASFQRLRIVPTIVSVFRNEGGVGALYKGLTPTLLGMVPYAGLSFYFFERLKYILLDRWPLLCGKTNQKDHLVLSIPSKLLCGGIAGAIAQSVSYPLDVTRRRMQLSMCHPETHKYSENLVKTLVLVYREHGVVNGLYRGLSINFLRASPMVAVSFSTYEIMKQALGLDTGVEL